MLKNCTLNFLPIRQNSNVHLRKYNNCGDDSSTFIPDDGNLWDIVIPDNTNISSNSIPETRYSVLYSLHISGTKYRFYSSKTDTNTNFTIIKMTESIKSNTIWRLLMIKE